MFVYIEQVIFPIDFTSPALSYIPEFYWVHKYGTARSDDYREPIWVSQKQYVGDTDLTCGHVHWGNKQMFGNDIWYFDTFTAHADCL